jgi:hypothetical protein
MRTNSRSTWWRKRPCPCWDGRMTTTSWIYRVLLRLAASSTCPL